MSPLPSEIQDHRWELNAISSSTPNFPSCQNNGAAAFRSSGYEATNKILQIFPQFSLDIGHFHQNIANSYAMLPRLTQAKRAAIKAFTTHLGLAQGAVYATVQLWSYCPILTASLFWFCNCSHIQKIITDWTRGFCRCVPRSNSTVQYWTMWQLKQ